MMKKEKMKQNNASSFFAPEKAHKYYILKIIFSGGVKKPWIYGPFKGQIM